MTLPIPTILKAVHAPRPGRGRPPAGVCCKTDATPAYHRCVVGPLSNGRPPRPERSRRGVQQTVLVGDCGPGADGGAPGRTAAAAEPAAAGVPAGAVPDGAGAAADAVLGRPEAADATFGTAVAAGHAPGRHGPADPGRDAPAVAVHADRYGAAAAAAAGAAAGAAARQHQHPQPAGPVPGRRRTPPPRQGRVQG